MQSKKSKSHVKKAQPKKVEKNEELEQFEKNAETVEEVVDSNNMPKDILCVYHSDYQDYGQKVMELLNLLSTHYDELEHRGDKLFEKLVSATTVSTEVKHLMFQEIENILKEKFRITHEKTLLLAGLGCSYLEKTGSQSFAEEVNELAYTHEATTPQK